MPSRAVLKKKLRREAKRSKAISAPIVQEDSSKKATENQFPLSATESSLVSNTQTEQSNRVNAFRKRVRDEESTDESSTNRLSRKERHQLETARRLQKEMDRIEAQQERARLILKANTNDGVSADSQEGQNLEGSVSQDKSVPMRHDPRFINGTFWRERKEKRARTVFCGGLPVKNFSKKQIEDLFSSTLRKDPNAKEYLSALDPEVPPVSYVDYLPLKHDAKVRNMYVTLASVPLAGCLVACLDGKEFNGRKLRCNFAADKAQRAEAIKRRNK